MKRLVFVFFAACLMSGGTQSTADDRNVYTDPQTGMEFVFVKGGCFGMGDTFGEGNFDEQPVHSVCVDDFYIAKYEVTQRQWKEIMESIPKDLKNCDNCPVARVSWNNTQEYIKKLSGRTGKSYRLPTEAEWEYAARSGGKEELYAGGNDLDSVAWHILNSGKKIHPVGQKKANGLGLYDMSGNVWEWVQDWYEKDYYKKGAKYNPRGADDGRYRVIRGGSCVFDPRFVRTSLRNGDDPTNGSRDYGFRLLLPVP